MNGSKLACFHVGVDVVLLLAWIVSVLDEQARDWPRGLESVGVFYRWWKWDTLCRCSLSIFHWSFRGYEKPGRSEDASYH